MKKAGWKHCPTREGRLKALLYWLKKAEEGRLEALPHARWQAATRLLTLGGELDAVDETDDVVAAAIASHRGDGFDDMHVVQIIV